MGYPRFSTVHEPGSRNLDSSASTVDFGVGITDSDAIVKVRRRFWRQTQEGPGAGIIGWEQECRTDSVGMISASASV